MSAEVLAKAEYANSAPFRDHHEIEYAVVPLSYNRADPIDTTQDSLSPVAVSGIYKNNGRIDAAFVRTNSVLAQSFSASEIDACHEAGKYFLEGRPECLAMNSDEVAGFLFSEDFPQTDEDKPFQLMAGIQVFLSQETGNLTPMMVYDDRLKNVYFYKLAIFLEALKSRRIDYADFIDRLDEDQASKIDLLMSGKKSVVNYAGEVAARQLILSNDDNQVLI